MSGSRPRTPIPKAENYGDNVVKENCERCRKLFVLNAIGKPRKYCYICSPPVDAMLFMFRPKMKDSKPVRPKKKYSSTLDDDKMLMTYCWCGDNTVMASKRLIKAGKTKSCGRDNCKEPT